MTLFDKILQCLDEGKCVHRASWSEGTFIYKQVSTEVAYDGIEKMSSLPQHTKDILKAREAPLKFRNQINIVCENNVVTHYHFSMGDYRAEDWFIFPNQPLTCNND